MAILAKAVSVARFALQVAAPFVVFFVAEIHLFFTYEDIRLALFFWLFAWLGGVCLWDDIRKIIADRRERRRR